MNQPKFKPRYKYTLMEIAFITGVLSAIIWICASAAEPDSKPFFGGLLFDQWMINGPWWNFFLAPIAVFIIPATLLLLTGHLGRFIYRMICPQLDQKTNE